MVITLHPVIHQENLGCWHAPGEPIQHDEQVHLSHGMRAYTRTLNFDSVALLSRPRGSFGELLSPSVLLLNSFIEPVSILVIPLNNGLFVRR